MPNNDVKATRRNIAALARKLAPDAIKKLEDLLKCEQASVAKDAAIHILDRAIGKPVALSADVTDRLDEFTDDELDSAIADLKARIASAGKAGESEGPPPITH
jgi:hypothetical protein